MKPFLEIAARARSRPGAVVRAHQLREEFEAALDAQVESLSRRYTRQINAHADELMRNESRTDSAGLRASARALSRFADEVAALDRLIADAHHGGIDVIVAVEHPDPWLTDNTDTVCTSGDTSVLLADVRIAATVVGSPMLTDPDDVVALTGDVRLAVLWAQLATPGHGPEALISARTALDR